MVPSKERFNAFHGQGSWLMDTLEMKDELLARERLRQAAFQFEISKYIAGRLVGKPEAVAATLLCPIHCNIRACEERLVVPAVFRKERDADRRRDERLSVGFPNVARKHAEKRLRQGCQGVLVRLVRDDYRELVS